MKFEQSYIPDFKFCPVCGTECKGETCKSECTITLEIVRSAIKTRTEYEKGGIKHYNPVTIHKFNDVQEKISK